ncbi:zinc-ribbon domain-containing protein [Roseivivax sp. GX 12232]|uniref:zinc-ribbon domain-containing protein n=1 Tax=Roseivivax sp. GX 12232 TaxID=2900547 RepID=UPI001E313BC7|nr:zinc-ribbon domain-containing protein [Roseivivax sp. GX 12232]MCE0506004.1 zinc-ribbon domain-containing protein [Roseivivax sp. GX 12232]
MRLICPNCGAQYEVPTEVIPEAGRDVQCSNCGHTWFEHHPDFAPEDDPAPDDITPRPAPEAHETPEDEGLPPPEEGPAPGAAATAPRRELDPEVTNVLREEARREALARRAEGGTIESQPDLGLDAPAEDEEAERARQSRARMEKMRGPEGEAPSAPAPAEATPEQPDPNARSGMLPDVDEINQTLRSAGDRRPVETPQGRAPDPEDRGRSGYGRGLMLVLVLALLAGAAYVYAAPLAEMAPAAAPALEGYVAQVNDLRAWLQATVEGLTAPAEG